MWALTNKEPFAKQDSLYQKIIILTRLRNELIHYEPKWQEIFDDPKQERNEMYKVGKQLQQEKFSLNPFIKENVPFFPDKCIGYGCAHWANEKSLDFVKKFCEKMGAPFEYEDVKQF